MRAGAPDRLCLAPCCATRLPAWLTWGDGTGRSGIPASPEPAKLPRGSPHSQIWLCEPVTTGERRGGRPRREPQLAEDVGHVTVDGVGAEHQALGDLLVGEPL